jgi:hypothetical protein
MKLQVPFYDQAWDLDAWNELGFASKQEAEYWKPRSCGVLSLKMAIDSFVPMQGQPASAPIAEYIIRGLALDAYIEPAGWKHPGLIRLAEAFNFHARTHAHVTPGELRNALLENKLPIISIKWAFKNHKTFKEKILFWKKYGGHLAVVTGFEESAGKLTGFYVHHTSIRPEYNWHNKFIPLKEFQVGFTGRCIIISKLK